MRAWIKERFRVLQVRAILHIHLIHSFFHDIKSTRFIYNFGPYLVAIWSVMLITSRCSPAPTSKLLPFPPPKPGTWLQHRWWGLRGRRWWGSVAIWFLQIVDVAGKQNKDLKPRDPYLAPTNHLYRGHCFMACLLLPKQRADSSLFRSIQYQSQAGTDFLQHFLSPKWSSSVGERPQSWQLCFHLWLEVGCLNPLEIMADLGQSRSLDIPGASLLPSWSPTFQLHPTPQS